ncbi:hypothetical protein ISCGN_009318 [Ixodes scapularis]
MSKLDDRRHAAERQTPNRDLDRALGPSKSESDPSPTLRPVRSGSWIVCQPGPWRQPRPRGTGTPRWKPAGTTMSSTGATFRSRPPISAWCSAVPLSWSPGDYEASCGSTTATGPTPPAAVEAASGGSGTWCPEQRDLLRRDVETLDLLVLKLEDLAGTLRDAMHLSSSQSSPQSPGSPGCRRVETAPYFIRFQLPIVALVQARPAFQPKAAAVALC